MSSSISKTTDKPTDKLIDNKSTDNTSHKPIDNKSTDDRPPHKPMDNTPHKPIEQKVSKYDYLDELLDLSTALGKATEYFPLMPEKFATFFNDAGSTVVVMRHIQESINKYITDITNTPDTLGTLNIPTRRKDTEMDALDLLYGQT